MRSPGEYYIRYLFSIPGMEVDRAVELADAYSIKTVNRSYMGLLQQSMTLGRPKTYKPETGTHRPTNEWLVRRRVSEMWRNTEGSRQALRVLSRPDIRERADTVLLSPLNYTESRSLLPAWLSAWGLKTYAHYFFNMALLDRAETEHLVNGMGGLRKHMFYVDADKELARMVMSYSLGKAPMDATVGRITRRTVDMLAFRMLQLGRSPASSSDAAMLHRYLRALASVHKLMTESESVLESFAAALSDIAVDGEPNEWVPSLEEYLGREDHDAESETTP